MTFFSRLLMPGSILILSLTACTQDKGDGNALGDGDGDALGDGDGDGDSSGDGGAVGDGDGDGLPASCGGDAYGKGGAIEEECMEYCMTLSADQCGEPGYCRRRLGELVNFDDNCLEEHVFVVCVWDGSGSSDAETFATDEDGGCWRFSNIQDVPGFENESECAGVDPELRSCSELGAGGEGSD